MKNRVNWLLIPAVALGLAACKKKEETTASGSPTAPETTEAAETASPAPPAAPALDVGERAAKLGFAKHLPQDTEVLMAFHNGSKTADRVTSSKIWKLVQSQMGLGGMGMGPGPMDMEIEEIGEIEEMDMEEAEQEATADAPADPMPEPTGPAALFGQEFSIALGKNTGDQTANLLTLNQRSTYFQMRSLAKGFASAVKSGDMDTLEDAFQDQFSEEMLTSLLNDPESGIALFEKMSMPPLYIAFRTSSAQRDGAAQQLASMTEYLGMMEDMVEPVEVEKAGSKFAGYKISGAKVSAELAEEREDMEEVMDAASTDRLLKAVASKDLVVLSGTIGDYALLFVGASADDLKFAASPAESMVSTDALAFTDAYASKELAAVIHGDKTMIDKMMAAAGGLSVMTEGIRDGLAGADGLGDTRDIEALLKLVAEREESLRQFMKTDSVGLVAFFEEGLKIESFGSTDSGALDWESPNRLTPLGQGDNVFLFANMTSDAAYDKEAQAYIEALVETGYAIATKVSEAPFEEGDIAEFKEATKIFDTQFRADLVAFYDAFSTEFSGGLGNECAMLVDLNGSVPTVPGIPQAVADEAKFPRLSVVAPVTDRAKLASAWTKMNASATNILAKVSEMAGEDIPMQKPISSEKNDYTTWFFSLPFLNDDFVPSVTVGEKWFAASTSKNQALDLIASAEKGGDTRKGLWLSMNFNVLRAYASETIDLFEKHAEDITGQPAPAEELQQARDVIDALDNLDSLTMHARREGGKLRSSIHFKTR